MSHENEGKEVQNLSQGGGVGHKSKHSVQMMGTETQNEPKKSQILFGTSTNTGQELLEKNDERETMTPIKFMKTCLDVLDNTMKGVETQLEQAQETLNTQDQRMKEEIKKTTQNFIR